MKQLLKSSAKIKLVILAAALVAAIVVSALIIHAKVRKSNIEESIRQLQEETENTNEEFKNKYSEIPEDEKAKLKDNLKAFIESILGRNTSYTFKDYDEIKSILRGYPSLYDDVVKREDIFSVLLANAYGGINRFDNFLAECRLGIPGYMVMAQFTSNLDPIYYYIEFDGFSYHIVVDQTRDEYNEEYGYVEAFGQYLKVERYQLGDGTVGEYGFLTDTEDTKYANVIWYFANVNSDPSLVEPEYWQFYMGIITPDQLEDRVLASDRSNKAFESEYTGFADMHPSFKDDNPMTDMDGDGIQDRIYRQFATTTEGQQMVNVYCMLGNGDTIILGKDIWGDRFKTIMCDVTNDGFKDICFVQYSNDPAQNKYGVSVYSYKNGTYVAEELPLSEGESIDITTDSSGLNVIKIDKNIVFYAEGTWNKRVENEELPD